MGKWGSPGRWCGLVLAWITVTVSFGAKPSLTWKRDSSDYTKAFVEADSVSPGSDPETFLTIYTGKTVGSVPLVGSYAWTNDLLTFHPRFGLQPGLEYLAVLKAEGETITKRFSVPRGRLPRRAEVAAIYPSNPILPENLLKFYIHFTQPMSRGDIYSHIHLLKENGTEVELPFLEIQEELWDAGMKRLTLFIDPGRIKRGVRPFEEIGPSLEEGRHFTLVIDTGWKDAAGQPLRREARKRFEVGPSDRTPLDPPAKWNITAPHKGTREALQVTFPEPMDHALALRTIHVLNAAGGQVSGTAKLFDHERKWSFRPDASWEPGRHQLLIETTIEDLAGNNIGKAFEVDLFEKVQRSLSSPTVRVDVQIR